MFYYYRYDWVLDPHSLRHIDKLFPGKDPNPFHLVGKFGPCYHFNDSGYHILPVIVLLGQKQELKQVQELTKEFLDSDLWYETDEADYESGETWTDWYSETSEYREELLQAMAKKNAIIKSDKPDVIPRFYRNDWNLDWGNTRHMYQLFAKRKTLNPFNCVGMFDDVFTNSDGYFYLPIMVKLDRADELDDLKRITGDFMESSQWYEIDSETYSKGGAWAEPTMWYEPFFSWRTDLILDLAWSNKLKRDQEQQANDQ